MSDRKTPLLAEEVLDLDRHERAYEGHERLPEPNMYLSDEDILIFDDELVFL